jgi:hypothetical protein
MFWKKKTLYDRMIDASVQYSIDYNRRYMKDPPDNLHVSMAILEVRDEVAAGKSVREAIDKHFFGEAKNRMISAAGRDYR